MLAIRSVSEFGVNKNTSPSPPSHLLPYCFIIGWLRAGKNSRGFVVEGAGYQAPDGLSRDTNHNSIDSATTPKYARPVFSYSLLSPLEIASGAEVRGGWNVIICPVRLFQQSATRSRPWFLPLCALRTVESCTSQRLLRRNGQARGRDFFAISFRRRPRRTPTVEGGFFSLLEEFFDVNLRLQINFIITNKIKTQSIESRESFLLNLSDCYVQKKLVREPEEDELDRRYKWKECKFC